MKDALCVVEVIHPVRPSAQLWTPVPGAPARPSRPKRVRRIPQGSDGGGRAGPPRARSPGQPDVRGPQVRTGVPILQSGCL